jgi:hemerythrin-like domain-containing protein
MRFTQISGNSAKQALSPTQGPLEILLGCHARIRHFVQLSRTLANAEGVPNQEISEAAAAIYRYFSHALPVHEVDENESLFSRLYAAAPIGGLVREAAETMVEQHKAIDELAEELMSLCAALERTPERLPGLALRLDRVALALDQIFAAHLRLEETVIFPAIRELLTPVQMAEMALEMSERRRQPLGTIHIVR